MIPLSTLEPYISSARIQSFKDACSGNDAQTLKLYLAHIKLSQAFYPLLSLLEVSLRNTLDRCCIAYFRNVDWIQTEKNRAFRYQQHIIDSITKAENKVGARLTHNRLVAELMFGFWTDFFSKGVYKVLLGAPYSIFAKLTPGTQRAAIYTKLSEIRLFRNRVYHNEPICFAGGSLNLTHAREIYESIIEVLNWIEPELANWSNELDQVELTIEEMEQIILECIPPASL